VATGFTLKEQVDTLYSDHHGWLFGWLRKKLGNSFDAADVAQDTFVRILGSRDALMGNRLEIREPRAYLCRTASHLLIDRNRRRALEEAYLEQLALLTDALSDCQPPPEQTLMAMEALMEIGRALEKVPAKARTAFLLHYLDGQTHAAVAEHLGVSTKMVQKYLIQVLMRCNARAL